MTSAQREVLSLDATPTYAANGWTLHLPVRREQISVSKQVFVRERVVVSRQQVEDVARVEARLLHEELRTSQSGPVEINERERTRSQPI